MGQADIWMPVYVGDYIAATQCLDAEESGCYLHLLMSSWIDGPLPIEYKKLMRLARLHGETKSVVLDEILGKYFELTEDGYINKRLEEERSKAQGRSAEATRKARLRWDSAKPKDNINHPPASATASTKAMHVECSSPSPSQLPISIHTEEKKIHSPAGRASEPEDFKTFYAAYPRKKERGDALKAFKTHRKSLPPIMELVAIVEDWKSSDEWTSDGGQYIPYPGKWIRRQGWLDEMKETADQRRRRLLDAI